MQQPTEPDPSDLAALLRALMATLQQRSGAELVSAFLFDSESRSYYAPFALGLPEDGMLEGLADMSEQLRRFEADAAQGKAPADLHVTQYGSTTWLTVSRRPLIARDAQAEVDSTFVRRYRVESMVGLPLLAGEQLMGLVYLDFCAPVDAAPGEPGARVPTDEGFAELEREAARAGEAIRDALSRADRAALEALGRLTGLLTAAVADEGSEAGAFRRRVSIAIADLLLASGLEAAVAYRFGAERGRLELVSANLPSAAPAGVDLPDDPAEWEPVLAAAVASAAQAADLHPIATLPLESGEELQGYLVLLSRDRLAFVRKPPATDLLFRTAAGLIGGALANRGLIVTLGSANRLLGALSRMTNAMLRPGSSRQAVMDAVVRQLTDGTVPEFDFHFATVNLLAETGDGGMVVHMAAGVTMTEAVDSAELGDGQAAARVPRWALAQGRELAPGDVLAFVARSWNVVVVGAVPRRPDESPDAVLGGALPGHLRWTQAPVVRDDGRTAVMVPVGLIPTVPLAEGRLGRTQRDPPFTLDAEIFEASGHGELIRIFLPFGLDQRSPATGVLEVGYHRSLGRRPDLTQVEALRAAAAQVAVAVETARLYEDARRNAEQLELGVDVAKAIASSIDLDQTLRLVARNLVRLVDASVCQIALYEEDGSGWHGAAASDQEELWRRQHGDRPDADFLFELLDRAQPLLIENARNSPLVGRAYTGAFGFHSLLALPLLVDGHPIGAAVLGQADQTRAFTAEEVQLAQGLATQAAVAIKNARLHALAEEERHIQKDFILVGFGTWGQKAYHHLLTLKQFFNFRIHVVERDVDGSRRRLSDREQEVLGNGDAFYWDSAESPAPVQLRRELESSCYAITYVVTPAATHLPTVADYYGISDVILIEKPLGAPPEEYRKFLDSAPGGVEIVAADHYYFKLEVRLLQLLLTEERTLRDFLESVEEIRIEILEEKPLTGAAADIGVIADLIPHAFAIVSLLTPIDRILLDPEEPLRIGRHEPLEGERESYARVLATFPYQGRPVRLVIDVGKGVEDAKWIKLVGEGRLSGRSPFYKFDFGKGDAIDGTQTNVRAATRRIREPGVPDNAHLTMLRHVIEKRRPAVGILSIREAIRSNQRIRELEAMATELLAQGGWTGYRMGSRPSFGAEVVAARAVAAELDGESAAVKPRAAARARRRA